MKLTDILSTAVSNLWRNKVRTILTVLAVFIGSFTIALTEGINIGVNEFINTQVGGIGAKDLIQVMAKQEGLDPTQEGPNKYNPESGKSDFMGNSVVQLNEKDIKKLEKIKGVKRVETSTDAAFEYIEGNNGEKYEISVTTVLPSLNTKMIAGKKVDYKAKENQISFDEDYVKALGYKNAKDAIGEKVTFEAKSATGEVKEFIATVVGVQEKNSLVGGSSYINEKFSKDVIEFNQKGMPEAMKTGSPALLVVAKSVDETEEVKEKIEKAGYIAMTFDDQIKSILIFVNAITTGLILFGVIALIAATFGIVNTLFMSVQERTREIGLMKALGLSKGKVFSIFSWEASLIGFFGSALGLLGAMGMGSIINTLAGDTFLKDLPQLTLIQFQIIPSVVIIALIMFIAFLAGALPARRAAKLDPIEALRSE
ncbi:putative ABC transport system permease protein [Pilibacter termitis]|uniref:Putative ABC transport system permease protein n=1 Tax=Pilibacter termitis TaxID=263852 RepID=A0A1T4LRU6_9ENTE|nr:ABC transporter permease [Pilibacter termitis]SJZ57248.1 putative ABC transport system permease protein [Pilibacter termitis]